MVPGKPTHRAPRRPFCGDCDGGNRAHQAALRGRHRWGSHIRDRRILVVRFSYRRFAIFGEINLDAGTREVSEAIAAMTWNTVRLVLAIVVLILPLILTIIAAALFLIGPDKQHKEPEKPDKRPA